MLPNAAKSKGCSCYYYVFFVREGQQGGVKLPLIPTQIRVKEIIDNRAPIKQTNILETQDLMSINSEKGNNEDFWTKK